MKKLLIGTIIFILFILWIFYLATSELRKETYGADCPVCEPCTITAKSIRQNARDYSGQRFEGMTKIILPESVGEIQIGENIYTKSQLDAIK